MMIGIEPPALLILLRAQKGQRLFPVAENMRLDTGYLFNFADGKACHGFTRSSHFTRLPFTRTKKGIALKPRSFRIRLVMYRR